MERFDRLPVLIVAVALLACKASAGSAEGLRAQVRCEGTNETIDCDVSHVDGDQAANVCWDLAFACQNGAQVTGQDFCQDVGPGSTVQKRIPISALSNASACDKAISTQVKNLRITAR